MSAFVERLSQQLLSTVEVLDSPGLFPEQAAVLALITDHPRRPELVFTLRAAHMRRHAGEVAFPGGKWEPQDPDLLATALRETDEEVALPPSRVQVLGACHATLTSKGTPVIPFVGVIAHSSVMVPNPNELQAIFRVPIDWFSEQRQHRVDVYRLGGVTYRVPAYHYGNYEIWGFTAAVTQEILRMGQRGRDPQQE